MRVGGLSRSGSSCHSGLVAIQQEALKVPTGTETCISNPIVVWQADTTTVVQSSGARFAVTDRSGSVSFAATGVATVHHEQQVCCWCMDSQLYGLLLEQTMLLVAPVRHEQPAICCCCSAGGWG